MFLHYSTPKSTAPAGAGDSTGPFQAHLKANEMQFPMRTHAFIYPFQLLNKLTNPREEGFEYHVTENDNWPLLDLLQ
ncbi:hypothetical protein B7P43_G12252 [Cryptotermes secundus]|uniref:Uncharacterized protein n=1 Tax=Cryptotermes secundus TaxID=105785 RepID=A0A2J7QHP2_9NEOP|nr:hypothetical protein B7P43_G12252 [Cryptotermes secundus]